MLHDDKSLFRQVVLLTSEGMGIDAGIIEKDYYVTAFLKSLVARQPQIIFKGGTSLSKSYNLIKRFSEDIDLNLECDKRPTESQRKHLKENIISTVEEFGFELTNPNQVRSRRDYNRYVIDFPSIFGLPALKQYLVVETSVFLRAYPSRKMNASSFVYEYLKQINRDDIIFQFALEPFELNVQSIERTFIDKLFALGDYYLDSRIMEHSRHIYDLHKMYDVIEIDDSLTELFRIVRKERSGHTACLSAQSQINLKVLLQKIIDENAYKSDYETVTAGLLFENVTYNTAINTLQKIVNSGLLD